MKNYKIIYYVGESIGLDTTVQKGVLFEENETVFVSKTERIALNTIEYSKLINLNGIGTMVKIASGSKIIFLAAYRVFLNIGTGFSITNYLGTLNIKKRMDVVCNSI